MSGTDFGGEWQPIATAPRDGTRILMVIHATEQGSDEVDVVRWDRPERSNEKCWIAVDSVAGCQFVYADAELVFWMPLPSKLPTECSTILAANLPEPPAFMEAGGSGI
jgi:hypothetical protein